MTKCSNCEKDAAYEYKITLNKSIFYCSKDLPKFLTSRKKALLIGTTPAHSQAKDEALSTLKITPAEPVVEEAPKKRTTKKKAE